MAFEIIGADVTVTFAAEAGQLQLNAFEPIIYASLADGFEHLTHAVEVLTTRCVGGIEANRDHMRRTVEESIGLTTVLNPLIGYTEATRVAGLALASGRRVIEILAEEGLVGAPELSEAMRVEKIAGLGDV